MCTKIVIQVPKPDSEAIPTQTQKKRTLAQLKRRKKTLLVFLIFIEKNDFSTHKRCVHMQYYTIIRYVQ